MTTDLAITARQEAGNFTNYYWGKSRSIDYNWLIEGDTYDIKGILKSYDCVWWDEKKVWAYPDEKLPDALEKLATRVVYKNDTPQAVEPETSTEPDPPVVAEPAVDVDPAPEPQVKIVEKEKIVYQYKFFTGKRKPMIGRYKARKHTWVRPQTNKPDIILPSYWDDLLFYLEKGHARPVIALVGPTGNGKTTVAEEACRQLGYEDFLVIDCNDQMEPFDLIGGMLFDPQKGNYWHDGPVTTAFRNGTAVILNEFDTLNPRTAMSLQSAFQDKGRKGLSRYITLSGNPKEDRVYPKADCPLILTMNTFGSGADRQYTGRNTLDAASLDRITLIPTVYENEAEILKLNGADKKTANEIVKWAHNIRADIDRHKLRLSVSNRVMLRILDRMTRGKTSLSNAIEKEFLRQIPPGDRATLQGKVTSRFGRQSRFGS